MPSGVSRLPPITSSIPSGSVTTALITSMSLDVIELMFVCNDRIFGDAEELAPPVGFPDPPPPPEPVPPPPIPDPHAVTTTATTSAPRSAPTLRVTVMGALVSRHGQEAVAERGPYRANAIRIATVPNRRPWSRRPLLRDGELPTVPRPAARSNAVRTQHQQGFATPVRTMFVRCSTRSPERVPRPGSYDVRTMFEPVAGEGPAARFVRCSYRASSIDAVAATRRPVR